MRNSSGPALTFPSGISVLEPVRQPPPPTPLPSDALPPSQAFLSLSSLHSLGSGHPYSSCGLRVNRALCRLGIDKLRDYSYHQGSLPLKVLLLRMSQDFVFDGNPVPWRNLFPQNQVVQGSSFWSLFDNTPSLSLFKNKNKTHCLSVGIKDWVSHSVLLDF